jgi:hypothetical protein
VAWPHIDKVCCSWSCSLGQLDRSSQHFSGTKVLMVALGDSGVQFVYRQRPTSRLLIWWSETTNPVATTTWPPEEKQLRDATTTRILPAGGLRVVFEGLPSSLHAKESLLSGDSPLGDAREGWHVRSTCPSGLWMFRNRTH